MKPCISLEHHILKLVLRSAALACGLSSAAAAQSASDFYPNIPAAQSAYQAYADTKDCAGAEFVDLLDILDARTAFAKSNLVTDNMGVSTNGVDIVNQTGLAYVAIGDLAGSKGCAKEARSIYLAVIESFTGVDFAALRERAMIGIDDLRTKS